MNKLRGGYYAFYDRLKGLYSAEVFAVLAGIFGFAFLLFTPPMQSPDEVEHFYRSYQVSDLQLVPEKVVAKGHGGIGEGYGGDLPKSVIETAVTLKGKVAGSTQDFDYRKLASTLGKPLNVSDRSEIRFDNTAIYSPLVYLPQASGIALGKLFNASPTVLSYLGRLANLVVWIALIYAAIRIAPIGKWAFVAIALNPLSLFLASNLSSDAVSIGIVALFVALVLKARTMSTASGKFIALLVILTIAVGLLKNAYLPVALLLFAVPSRILPVRFKMIIFGLAAITGIVWNLLIFPAAKEIPEYFNLSDHIDPRAQVGYVLDHPRVAIGNLVWNVFGTPSILLTSSYNGLIGWGDVPLPFWLSLMGFMAIVFSLLYRDATQTIVKKVQNRTIRIYFAVVLSFAAAAVVISLYAGWTTVGGRLVSGVQGRYFIPLSFLLIPIITNTVLRIVAPRITFAKIIIRMHFIILSTALIILGTRYISGIYW